MKTIFLLLAMPILYAQTSANPRFNALPTGFVSAESAARSGKRLLADPSVLAFAPTRAGRVLFTSEGALFPAALPREEANGKHAAERHAADLPDGPQALVVLGSAFARQGKRAVEPRLERPLPGRLNFLIGPEEDWQVGLTSYGELVYPDAWPGVDLIFEARAEGLGYRLELSPAADPAAIELSTGAERLLPQDDGSLRAEHSGSWLRISRPRAFQRIGDAEQEVVVAFAPGENGRYGFALGAYDPRLPLTIDPSLTWSTYLGGSGYLNEGAAIAVDGLGSAYVTGYTSSDTFPATAGALDTSYNGSWDVFVSKFSANGNSLLYCTYLGGASGEIGKGIAVDSAGSAYVTGYTTSNDFPVTAGAFDTSYNGGPLGYPEDAFVCKLNGEGSALLYSTFLGGSLGSETAKGIALDSTGCAYVVGSTFSADFPTTVGAFSPSIHSPVWDGFVTKINANGSSLVYSSYLGGGDGADSIYGIAVDDSFSAFVTGSTSSTDFPTTAGAYDTSFNGGPLGYEVDAFICKVHVEGSALLYSTFLGGANSYESSNGISVDSDGSAYVTGYTLSTDFPTTPGAFATTLQGTSDAYVCKLSPDGSTLAFSTFLGGERDEVGCAIAVNSVGSVYVTGSTNSTLFPTTLGAFDTTLNGGPPGYDNDVFFSKLSTNGSTLLYSTFLGGAESREGGRGIAVDNAGSAYLTGSTISPDFPTTTGAFDTSYNGGESAFVSKLCPIAQPGAITGPATVCSGASGVNYSIAAVLGAQSYTWSLPAGSTISAGQGTHSITVTFGSVSGDIRVTANAPCPSDPQILAVTLLEGVSISGQPASASVCPGGSALFSVYASGAGLSFQWRKNGSDLAGHTGAFLYLDGITIGDAGDYDCLVSGSCGNALSSAAALTVWEDPVLLQHPESVTTCDGSFVSFSVSASGGSGSFLYQWYHNSSQVASGDATLTLASVSAADAGSYHCEISSSCGFLFSNAATLTVQEGVTILSQPASSSACPGDSVSFSVSASGSGLSYHWRKNGSPLSGQTSATLSLTALSPADAGSYDCLVSGSCASATSNAAVLTVQEGVSILSQPSPASTCSGGSATFSIDASGAGLTYQWRKNGNDLVGQTGVLLHLDGITIGDAGDYDCLVIGSCGSATSNAATLTVQEGVSIGVQPASTNVCPGGSVSFIVTASGAGLSYQWRKNGYPLSGQTSATLSLTAIAPADAGSYDCLVSGTCGGATSNPATLTVQEGVSIGGQPASTSACPGDAVSFSVTASGAGLSYQWRKNGSPLSGQTSATLSLTAILPADAGSYDCLVSGTCGVATSAAAALTLWQEVVFSQQPASAMRCLGDSVSFSVSASGTAPLSFQWYHDGWPLPGAVSASLSLAAVAGADAGSYHCEVANLCGSVSSNAAQLILDPNLMLVLSPPGAAQGVHFLTLNGGTLCGIPDYELQWTNLTTGYAYPIDENPITISPVLSETSFFEFRVTDGRSRATVTAQVPVLVHHFDVLDWDGNGCSELADLWQALQHWRSAYPGDPNDDGFLDVRDFLYINTDGCP